MIYERGGGDLYKTLNGCSLCNYAGPSYLLALPMRGETHKGKAVWRKRWLAFHFVIGQLGCY